MPTINNRFENLTLERLQEIYDLIVTPGGLGLSVGVTPITGGTVGRLLFQGGGNVLQQSGNLFWDEINNRLGVNTSSPAFAIDVNGTARIRGNTTIIASVGATQLTLGGLSNLPDIRFIDDNLRIGRDSAGIMRFVSQPGAVIGHFNFGINSNLANSSTSGTATGINAFFTFAPTSGNAVFNLLTIAPTILQTGGANGITRGLHVNPTLLIASDFRAIETTAGKVIFGGTDGVLIPRLTTTQKNAIATPAAGLVIYDTDLKQLCVYDGTWGLSPFYQGSLRGVQYFTDFEGTPSNTPNFAAFSVGGSVNRVVTNVPNWLSNQIGIAQYATGTTATGYFTHINEGFITNQFIFGGGAWIFETFVNVETLSTSTERFRFVSGFGNAPTNASEQNGAFFTYDEGGIQNGTIASPNWQCITAVSSVRTLTTTSTAVVASAWVKLRIEVNAAGTSVTFYVNGTLVATHTTNIPTYISGNASRGFDVKQSILKSTGTTNRNVFCDYLLYQNQLTTLR